MAKHKPLAAMVTEKHGDVPGWAKAARVSESLCYAALRGVLPKQPLLYESMAEALGLDGAEFTNAVAACGLGRAKRARSA